MFKHLLIPTDGSEQSQRAVHAGIDFARKVDAKVTLITVSKPFHLIPVDDPMLAIYDEDAHLKATHEIAEARLREGEEYGKSQGVTVMTLHVYDDVVYRAIIEAALKYFCDLIFMASHGKRGMIAMLLGSETVRVLTHSRLPVLVYR
jgi:nucleotide-binding universal stress UspA family protein